MAFGIESVRSLPRSYVTFFIHTTEWGFIRLIRLYYFQILQLVFPCNGNTFDKSLHGRFSETELSGVRSLRVVSVHPRIKVGLQLLDRGVYSLSEGDGIELILHGSVKPFTDTVCLRAFRLDL